MQIEVRVVSEFSDAFQTRLTPRDNVCVWAPTDGEICIWERDV